TRQMRVGTRRCTWHTHGSTARWDWSDDPDEISAPDGATLSHTGVDADVCPVVAGGSAQDAAILWEIALRQGGHHAPRAGLGDVQAHLFADRQRVTDPPVFQEAPRTVGGCHYQIGPKPPGLEPSLGIELPEPIEGGRGDQMEDGGIEK